MVRNINIYIFFIATLLIIIGDKKRAVIPRISPILAIFEPIALPIAKSILFCQAASIPTMISGAEVAKPTITRPIIRGGILN